MKKTRLLGLFTVLALIAAACSADSTSYVEIGSADAQTDANGDKATRATGNITMGRAEWSSGYVHAQILHNVLEELGYNVASPHLRERSPDLGYNELATGTIDVWANAWMPGHTFWFDDALPDGSVIGDNIEVFDGSLMPGGGAQGFLITKAWADANNITCLLYTSPSPRDKRQSRMPSSA